MMKQFLTFLFFSYFFTQTIFSQSLYFPPSGNTSWDTLSPQSLGWCPKQTDSLYRFLETTNSKAFIVLKNGKIVLEKYFGTFVRDSVWYWASAGKTLTGFTVGIAQQEGFLRLSDTTSKYLGKGWTSETRAQEDKITIFNQLTMTSGLRDGSPDNDCTQPSCLVYAADAGSRWAYHNPPYTLLDSVVAAATGQSFNAYVREKILTKIGMNGLFVKSGNNNVFFSNARNMARFGLLLLNKGKWNNTVVLSDTAYFRQMTTSSQTLNPAYGYLTWLNGKGKIMLPNSQIVLPRNLNTQAPADMYAAMGKNGQIINVVPSQNLVVIRMGNDPDNSPVPFTFNDEMWKYMNQLTCSLVSTSDTEPANPLIREAAFSVSPNPSSGVFNIKTENYNRPFSVFTLTGQEILRGSITPQTIDLQAFAQGFYFFKIGNSVVKIVRN